jgi:hypothetical protein
MKKTYEKPTIQSEAIFEALTSGCTITLGDGECEFAGVPNVSV